jgi:hypothetical protein
VVNKAKRPFAQIAHPANGASRSIGLNAGSLDLARPIIEVIADKLYELLRRLVNQLERIGLEQSMGFRRGEGSRDIGSDLIDHRPGQIGWSE